MADQWSPRPQVMGLAGPVCLNLWGDACFAQSLSQGKGPGDTVLPHGRGAKGCPGGHRGMSTTAGAVQGLLLL